MSTTIISSNIPSPTMKKPPKQAIFTCDRCGTVYETTDFKVKADRGLVSLKGRIFSCRIIETRKHVFRLISRCPCCKTENIVCVDRGGGTWDETYEVTDFDI